MADIVSSEKRSQMMAGIRGKDTKPELVIRRGLHRLGFRFRLHDKRLPGTPDLVLRRHNAVIFVHGCFWHGHSCHLFKWPKSREGFWREKINRNVASDTKALSALLALGWRVGVVWECSIRGRTKRPLPLVLDALDTWLRGSEPQMEIGGL